MTWLLVILAPLAFIGILAIGFAYWVWQLGDDVFRPERPSIDSHYNDPRSL